VWEKGNGKMFCRIVGRGGWDSCLCVNCSEVKMLIHSLAQRIIQRENKNDQWRKKWHGNPDFFAICQSEY
jgi:hypothetical protein